MLAPAFRGASSIVTAAEVGMVALGLWKPSFVDPAFTPIFIVFGIISIVLGISDIRAFMNPPARKGAWLLAHVGNMIGSYIAALTAFSATNLHFLPLLLRWLWPTAVLVPVIIYMTGTRAAKMTAVWDPTP